MERLKELLHPIEEGTDTNYESVDNLPIDDTPHDDKDASNPDLKGEK